MRAGWAIFIKIVNKIYLEYNIRISFNEFFNAKNIEELSVVISRIRWINENNVIEISSDIANIII